MTAFWRVPAGAVAVCEIYELFEHSGICTGEQQIIELHGSGLVRVVGAERFLHGRSGDWIDMITDRHGRILSSDACVQRALSMIYQQVAYDVIDFNCHRFTFYCVSGQWKAITSFYDLKIALSDYYRTDIKLLRLRSN